MSPIKPGFTLYATKADGDWFVKQAKSPRQFQRLCIEEQKSRGYNVPPGGRHWYLPDIYWDDTRKGWYECGTGEFWHARLPDYVRASLRR